MTLRYGPRSREESARSDDWPPAQLSRSRKPMILGIVGVLITILGAAGVIWWLLDSTVPVDDYEAVTASLSAMEAELADVSADNINLGDEVAALSSESERLEGELADLSLESQRLEERLGSLIDVARAIAVVSVWYEPEYLAELRDFGLDETMADQMLVDVGFNEPLAQWAETNNWQDVNRIMMQVSDERAQEAWDEFASAEIGSGEEGVAFVEFTWRLTQLLLQDLMEFGVTTAST